MTPQQKQQSERLKALRARLELTQAGLARKLGVHPRTYQQWELGLRLAGAAAQKLFDLIEEETKR